MELFYTLLIGLLAGMLAGWFRRGRGYGLIVNTIVGIIGSYVGYFLLRLIQPNAQFGWFGDIVVAFVGALIFLGFIGLFRNNKD